MAFQMMITIGGGAWGGHELDQAQQNEKPIWTIVFSLLGIAISLYLIIRSASKMSEDD
jgi:F0F1-type ATP synthase assembly protein I